MATSRIIVKNLPKQVTETKLRDLFGKQGTITDVQLKYTPDGRFRHFAFVGFSSENEAEAARLYFDKTYMGATKLDVQSCAKLGDPNKTRAWSKYAPDSSKGKALALKRKVTEGDSTAGQSEEKEAKKPRKKKKEEEILEKCSEDPDFLEFLEIHRKKSSWGNDTVLDELRKFATSIEPSEAEPTDSGSTTVATGQPNGDDVGTIHAEKPLAKKSEKPLAKKSKKSKKSKNLKTSEEIEENKETQTKKKKRRKVNKSSVADLFTVKIRNLPEKAKKTEIKEFFAPLQPKSIRLPPKFRGFAYIGFKTEEEFKNALRKDKSFILGNRITVRQIDTKKIEGNPVEEKLNKWASQSAELEKECETVGESGRIFIRNLSYTSTEDQIQELFDKFGPVTEVHLPLDRLTRKIKGFGFISFLLPEHATKAFNELDGTIFQGRMLHLLPSKAKVEPSPDEIVGGSAFKKQKALKQKKTAGSSYNWNSLFIGQNAVAKVVSDKYGVSREQLLLDKEDEDDRKQMSIGVRMALAEAEIVDETKNFLVDNDVCLESFENIKSVRSKTVILAKNLPANTVAKDLVNLFSQHGEIGRLILPPSGVTAIVEFIEPAEARAAFKKLSYTNFAGMPLYLEWAPLDTFKSKSNKKSVRDPTMSQASNTENPIQKSQEPSLRVPSTSTIISVEEDSQLDMVPEPDTTLFVKNLNFNTKEPSMKKHFTSCGPVYSVTIARKQDSKHQGQHLSMGYGFVQFYQNKHAQKALRELEGTMLENHILELKKSNRTLQTAPGTGKMSENSVTSKDSKANGSKLLVRNVPFEANQAEIKQLFQPFGEIRACRLPLKMDGSGEHRGFAFVDFMSQAMALKAVDTLGKSTHLYGRRLVIEWAQKEETVESLREKTAHQFVLQTTASRDKDKTSAKKGFTRYFNSQDSKKSVKEDEDDEDE